MGYFGIRKKINHFYYTPKNKVKKRNKRGKERNKAFN
ncbi:MAG: hypothetical protein MRECE_2c097 [Mycoplasmataceae bacterium CE_OT135]|nr:MAG: hypothetical protein MRECE_2c097 [Mycoplasmataceae bacterium CE_OT135]